MAVARLDYGIERQRHEGFVGRETMLAELDRLLIEDKTDRWIVVTGGPGMGKSAILAAWLLRREVAGAVVPHHFIRRGQYGWDEPATIVRSLAAQIEVLYPVQRDPDARPESRLVDLLSRVSARELAPRGGRLVLLVDGLDEYDAPVGTYDPLAAFLPHALPRGVRLLCASRPRHPYLDALEARDGALTRLDLDASTATDDNDATVRAFWGREAAALGLDEGFVEEAVARAGGAVSRTGRRIGRSRPRRSLASVGARVSLVARRARVARGPAVEPAAAHRLERGRSRPARAAAHERRGVSTCASRGISRESCARARLCWPQQPGERMRSDPRWPARGLGVL